MNWRNGAESEFQNRTRNQMTKSRTYRSNPKFSTPSQWTKLQWYKFANKTDLKLQKLEIDEGNRKSNPKNQNDT